MSFAGQPPRQAIGRKRVNEKVPWHVHKQEPKQHFRHQDAKALPPPSNNPERKSYRDTDKSEEHNFAYAHSCLQKIELFIQ